MKRNTGWMCASAVLLAGAVAATAGAQKPPETLPPPGPDAPAPQGSAPGTELPPPPPPPATTQPPGYPPGAPPQGYPPGYAPPGYYPGYAPPQGYYPPGYGYPGYGQPAYGPPPPYAQGYPMPGPAIPPPPEERGVHLHDGFYMRLAIGAGQLNATIKPEGDGDSAKLSGSGLALDFGFGGAVVDGFIIGGRLAVSDTTHPDIEVAGDKASTKGSATVESLQVFTDIYPWADGGFHLLAGIGPGFLGYDPTPNNATYAQEGDTSNSSGYAGTFGVGYEGWVDSQWAIGGMFNLNWGRFKDDVTITAYDSTGQLKTVYAEKSTITVLAPNITFTATFN